MKQIKRLLKYLAAIILFFYATDILAQKHLHYSEACKKKIHEVENNLISWVKLDSNQNWNIYDRMKALNIKGVSIAVINNYKIEWAKSYGWADSTEKKRVTNQTLFQAASVSKSINAFAFMKLMQDKKVNFDEDINAYLQSWKFPYDTASHDKKITLAEILSHTAGLNVHGFDGYKWNDSLPSLKQILNGEKPANNPAIRSAFEPGLKFEYSGGGIEISQQLLEDVLHSSYQSFIENNIFKPLNITASNYSDKPVGNYATAYRFDEQPIGCRYHIYPEKAAAGLWTTATDLAKFVIEIQLSLKGVSNKVLTQKTTELMLTPYLQSSNAAFGFFVDKKGNDYYFQHSGLNEGFSSQYYGSMKGGNGVVVLVNSDNTDFMAEVVNSVATVYGWKNFYEFAQKKIIKVADSITDKYIGRYKFDNTDNGPSIIKEKGVLYLVDPNSPTKWEIYFTSEKEFFMIAAHWANQQFFTDEKGQVKGFYILGDNYKVTVNKSE
ncbi:MAG TPA: serine hydrolase domain-containing protein [Puia sp.]|nr:serine hydrolase domain-containing protein [Puia sp.]